MNKVTRCEVIIRDDFNNVLIVQKKVKKNEPKPWSILGKEIRAKEAEEDCIIRIVETEVKSVATNIVKVCEYETTEGKVGVYECVLIEIPSLHKSIADKSWVSEKNLDNYELSENHRKSISIFWGN